MHCLIQGFNNFNNPAVCIHNIKLNFGKRLFTNFIDYPSKLREILSDVKTAIRKTNPDYDLVIDRLHLYYDMHLFTFGIDRDKNLIVQFPVFIQPYTQQPLILYQIETVPVAIIDQNTQAQSYMLTS